MFSPLIYAQDTNKETTKSEKPKGPLPPYLCINMRFGSLSIVGGGSPSHHTPTFWTLIEFTISDSVKPVYFYTQLRYSVPLVNSKSPVADILPIVNIEAQRLGFLLGFGSYLLDRRNTADIGWQICFNTGFVMEFGMSNNHSSIKFDFSRKSYYPQQFINVGFDLNTRFRYNFHKYFGTSLGFDFGYLLGILSGDSFYIGKEQKESSSHMILYAITFGFHF